MTDQTKQLRITSTAFHENGQIPGKYTCDGNNIRPPLHIENIPEEAKSLVLIVEDPDAPKGTFTHLVSWNIAPVQDIKENESAGVIGKNDFGQNAYGGPCPPGGSHHYKFEVFALDKELDLNSSANKVQLQKAMQGHVIAEGILTGLYQRKK